MRLQRCVFILAIVPFVAASARHTVVRARTDSGWVCGVRRRAVDGSPYASFRGVPYAKQPTGNLRFKRFEHIHIDIVGPLPISQGKRYLVTIIDRCTSWPEAFPVEDITAETIARTVYEGWITRFGCPIRITTDQGRQFESATFGALSKFLGVHKIRTTPYHPQANGMVERFHRTLKAALMARNANVNWVKEIPSVLFGLRNCFRDDTGYSSAELVYGTSMKLPGEFFEQPSTNTTYEEFITSGSPKYTERPGEELQPSERWCGCLDASVEGPVCPHHDVIYGSLMKPRVVSDACIYANIHVPLHPTRGIKWPGPGLPIVVFIHGGAWYDGSGGSDLNGPEYLVPKGVILITFNYRMTVFGFLSLNTSKIPGNNGLRDMVTLLRWVQTNARNFGGNPCDVTLAGQSAGATSAHLLSLSPYTQGLFNRIWMMSGTAIQSYFTTSPQYAQKVASSFLTSLGVNTTDYDEVHDLLVQMPLDNIMNASASVLSQFGMTSFVPVKESPLPNVIPIVAEDPEILISQGCGNNIPLVIGYTNVEAESIRPRLEEVNILELYNKNKAVGLAVNLLYTYPENAIAIMAERVADRYFGNEPVTIERYVKLVTDSYFAYPAAKVARMRAASGGAPVYLYKFSYNTENAVFKVAFGLNYTGAAHSDDLFRILKVNSLPIPASYSDENMTDWMTDLFSNYIKHGDPAYWSGACAWPAEEEGPLWYQNITSPQYSYIPLTDYDQEMFEFFDNLTNV